ncbi:MAG: hypothetical protein H6R20_1394, partial [Proteobacteria bacterium]|nr:hypothetical protein [Pseudomonadota bacterium]
MTDAAALRQFCVDSVVRNGLTVVGELFHQFPAGEGSKDESGGVTGCVVLAES